MYTVMHIMSMNDSTLQKFLDFLIAEDEMLETFEIENDTGETGLILIPLSIIN